jgi:hypothetical protein
MGGGLGKGAHRAGAPGQAVRGPAVASRRARVADLRGRRELPRPALQGRVAPPPGGAVAGRRRQRLGRGERARLHLIEQDTAIPR